MDTGHALYQFPMVSKRAQKQMIQPLKKLLEHSGVTKVMSNCQPASALLLHQFGCTIAPIFDLQVSCSPCNSCLFSAVLCEYMCNFCLCTGGMWGCLAPQRTGCMR